MDGDSRIQRSHSEHPSLMKRNLLLQNRNSKKLSLWEMLVICRQALVFALTGVQHNTAYATCLRERERGSESASGRRERETRRRKEGWKGEEEGEGG